MRNEYYQWLISQVCDKRYDSRYYSKLLFDLDNIEYTWSMELDENRAKDAMFMRRDYGYTREGPVSVLEMMVALVLRMNVDGYIDEETINPMFWNMIKSLGLYFNDDYNYDSDLTDECIERMLNREYRSNGDGGLFIIDNPRQDMRDVQIWQQGMWYITRLYLGR